MSWRIGVCCCQPLERYRVRALVSWEDYFVPFGSTCASAIAGAVKYRTLRCTQRWEGFWGGYWVPDEELGEIYVEHPIDGTIVMVKTFGAPDSTAREFLSQDVPNGGRVVEWEWSKCSATPTRHWQKHITLEGECAVNGTRRWDEFTWPPIPEGGTRSDYSAGEGTCGLGYHFFAGDHTSIGVPEGATITDGGLTATSIETQTGEFHRGTITSVYTLEDPVTLEDMGDYADALLGMIDMDDLEAAFYLGSPGSTGSDLWATPRITVTYPNGCAGDNQSFYAVVDSHTPAYTRAKDTETRIPASRTWNFDYVEAVKTRIIGARPDCVVAAAYPVSADGLGTPGYDCPVDDAFESCTLVESPGGWPDDNTFAPRPSPWIGKILFDPANAAWWPTTPDGAECCDTQSMGNTPVDALPRVDEMGRMDDAYV
jgi:acetyltransferase-like isoleucine patch superfamily enzyme